MRNPQNKVTTKVVQPVTYIQLGLKNNIICIFKKLYIQLIKFNKTSIYSKSHSLFINIVRAIKILKGDEIATFLYIHKSCCALFTISTEITYFFPTRTACQGNDLEASQLA